MDIVQQRKQLDQADAQIGLLQKQQEKIGPEIEAIKSAKLKSDSDAYLNYKAASLKQAEIGKVHIDTIKSGYDYDMAKEAGTTNKPGAFGQTMLDLTGMISKRLGTHPSQLNNQTKSALSALPPGVSNNPLDAGLIK